MCSPRINMDLTDWVSRSENDDGFQHDCLHVLASIEKETNPHQIISYCLSESSSTWNIDQNNLDQKFSFAQLHQQNVTTQQLYLWSAPIDVIERYQFYLNQLSTADHDALLALQPFYNCTSPRFGPLCQYSLDIYESHHSSLNEIIYEFYNQEDESTTLTCYTHLQCDRGSESICLDWSEICDGTVDCRNGIDEEFCWQLQDNVCEDNAYRCTNAQCIARTYLRDDPDSYECLDQSDESRVYMGRFLHFFVEFHDEPTFKTEDILCPVRHSTRSAKLTSSCFPNRDAILRKLRFSDIPNPASDNCWLAFQCELSLTPRISPSCRDLCSNKTCAELINEICPDSIHVPAGTIAFGHVFFIYKKEFIKNFNAWPPPPQYVCYNDQLCDGFYPNKSLISFDNATCRRPEDFPLTFNSFAITRGSWYNMYVPSLFDQMKQCNRISSNNSSSCNNLTMYKCLNSSKCISRQQLCNRLKDCDHNDDEQCTPINGSCALYGLDTLFECTTVNICISSSIVEDGTCHCQSTEHNFCDDEYSDLRYIRKHISFTTICDGFTELLPLMLDGRNETDETECQYWQCNNTYTRCDGFWNCFDGADEVDCDPSPIFQCPPDHHICVSSITNEFMCLPVAKANDGMVDCLGGTDEPKLCRSSNQQSTQNNFYCLVDADERCTSTKDLCYSSNCQDESDMQFCDTFINRTLVTSICWEGYETIRSTIENFFCTRRLDMTKPQMVPFAVGQHINSTDHFIEQQTNAIISASAIEGTPTHQHQQTCHRGLPLRVWLDKNGNSTNTTCLCPPSFYGNLCQYQNQRVSLTVKFQAFSDSRRTLFAILLTLVDDSPERIIHSYQQIAYLYAEHCRMKFNIYLLYSNRPKLPDRNYSIHIEIYEKISLAYRSSLLIPLKFAFLPVHRIAVQLNIPSSNSSMEICSDQKCIHGRCNKYSDDPSGNSFCRCDERWSGRYCTIPYNCTCSSDSWCAGVSANNRSICICPRNTWGSRCLLQITVCQHGQNATCQNGGQCISVDENRSSKKQFICICSKGFSGERCEIADKTIIVSFHQDVILPQSILMHFFRLIGNHPPEIGSTYRPIPTDQRSMTIFWSQPFHIAAVELLNDSYYLVTAQETYNRSSILTKTIYQSDRCAHVREVFNETIVQLHLLRRIKYYHLPCQNRSPSLSCFYDDSHFCLCNDFGDERVANCFEFNSSMKHDCFGQSNCENGAQCLQNRPTCPQTSVCVCPKCFYGITCQFSSSLFGLSLDSILGYHIRPHTMMKDQPSIVQVSVALTVLMFIMGLINGSLSLMTFINKEPRKMACGVYLLASSITSFYVMTFLVLKFCMLMIAQISSITNRSFLYVQCMSLDFLLHIGLNMDQWLSACVAFERAVATMKGASYNQNKSKKLAKYLIAALVFITVSTTLHDPIHRRLLDENEDDIEEKRIWCIVRYSTGLRTFNSIIFMFHFLGAFFVNIISAIIIILTTARQRTSLQTHQTYREILHEQFQQHIRLLIAPVILIILALPRLIITFVGGCMKSTGDSWLFLLGYFISFVPSTVTFLVFVFPSKTYNQVFETTVKQYRRRIQSWFNLNY